jgi:hypothetical protein
MISILSSKMDSSQSITIHHVGLVWLGTILLPYGQAVQNFTKLPMNINMKTSTSGTTGIFCREKSSLKSKFLA